MSRQEVTFATKPRLALAMIERAIAAGVPFAWVAADSVYGVGEIETALRRAGKGYVLGVNGSRPFNSWGGKPPVAGTAEAIAQALPARRGRACRPARAPRGRGSTTGPISSWPTSRPPSTATASPARGRAACWSAAAIADGELAFFTTWCPAGTAIETLVDGRGAALGDRGRFETAKNELGLDHNETRSWHGWHRHVSLVMLAFAMLAVIRHRANRRHPQKRCSSSPGRARPHPLVGPGNPPHRHHASPSGASSPPASSPGHSGDAPTKPPHNAHT